MDMETVYDELRAMIGTQAVDQLKRLPCAGGIARYIVKGIPPGGFVTAIITNNLVETFGRADIINREMVYDYVQWFYNHAPVECWKSEENMNKWIESRQSVVA